jgi:pimeloyl-ACP methyl ester carboxylesterase
MLNYKTVSKSEKLPWMLCVHGAGGNINTWKFQIEDLSESFQLLLVDLRDHGDSTQYDGNTKAYTFDLIAKDVLEVVDHLKLTQLNVLSLSMGSMIVQQMAMMRPELIRHSVYAGGVFHVTLAIHLFAHTAWILTKFIPYKQMYRMFSWLVMPRKNHQLSRRLYMRQSALLTQQAYDRWIRLYGEFKKTLRSYYNADINIPSLVIMGSQDYIFLKAARRYARKSRFCQLEIIDNCGHICNIERSRDFNQLVLKHTK